MLLMFPLFCFIYTFAGTCFGLGILIYISLQRWKTGNGTVSKADALMDANTSDPTVHKYMDSEDEIKKIHMELTKEGDNAKKFQALIEKNITHRVINSFAAARSLQSLLKDNQNWRGTVIIKHSSEKNYRSFVTDLESSYGGRVTFNKD